MNFILIVLLPGVAAFAISNAVASRIVRARGVTKDESRALRIISESHSKDFSQGKALLRPSAEDVLGRKLHDIETRINDGS